MKHTKKQIPQLSASDMAALLTALPLVSLGYTEDRAQELRNQSSVQAAALKLENKIPKFTANELRVIFVAIGFALEVLSGQGDDVLDISAIDIDWKSDLSRYFFTYNRLYPSFCEVINEIESHIQHRH